MKKYTKLFAILSALVVVSMLFTACQPTTTTATQEAAATTQEAAAATEAAVVTEEAAPATEEVATTQTGGTIRYAVIEDMTTQNVWALYDNTGASMWNYVEQDQQWPTLFGYSDQRFDWVPVIAADIPGAFTQEGEFWTNTITLKEGALWSDGTLITADDVAFTANTALKFRLGLNWQSAYNPDYLDHVEAVNAATVKFFFKTEAEPGIFTWNYGALMGKIVNKAFWEALVQPIATEVDALTGDPTSTDYQTALGEIVKELYALDPAGEPLYGAFNVSKWETGAYVETTKNDSWYYKGINVEEYANGAYREFSDDGSFDYSIYGDPTGDTVLTFKYGPFFDQALYTLYDQDAALLALRNKDVDFVLTSSGLTQGQVQQVQDDPTIKVLDNKDLGFRFLGFNLSREYLNNTALRQAVACVIDLDFLAQSILQGQVKPVYTLVPESITYWQNPDVPKFCQGLDAKARMLEAVRLMKEAGYTWTKEPSWNEERGGSVEYGEGLIMPDGTAFPEITILAPSAGYDPLRATSGVYIEQWMRELGIPVTAELTNFNNILVAVNDTHDYDMYLLGWSLSLSPDYLCTFFNSGDGTSETFYKSDELGAKCAEMFAATDLETAKPIVFELQKILATDLPYITLFARPVRDAYSTSIEFPYTEVIGGVGPTFYGFPALVMPVAQ